MFAILLPCSLSKFLAICKIASCLTLLSFKCPHHQMEALVSYWIDILMRFQLALQRVKTRACRYTTPCVFYSNETQSSWPLILLLMTSSGMELLNVHMLIRLALASSTLGFINKGNSIF